MRRDRWDLTAAFLSDGIAVTTAHGELLATGREELSDPGLARRIGFGVGGRTVLSALGDQLALMAWCDDDLDGEPFRRFAVVELNRRAEIERITQFDWDIDSLIAAADLLDDRLVEIDPPSAVMLTGLRFVRAFRHRNVEQLTRILHDDFESDDRRSLGFGAQDKAGWLRLFEAPLPIRIVTVLGRVMDETDAGLAVRMSQWALVDGELTEALPGCFVAHVRDGRLLHTGGFDDAEAALARLEELTVEQVRARSVHDDPWNEADQLTHRFLAGLAARDVDGYFEDLAEDVVLDDRRELIRAVHDGRDEVMAVSSPGIYPPDHELAANVESIAVRGDDLALHHCTISEIGEHDGPTMEWLSVTLWIEGRLARAVLFDPDAHLAAIDELDRLFHERYDDDGLRLLLRELGAAYRGICERDADRVLDLGHPDYTMTDHRGIGWGTIDSDGFRLRIQSIMDLDADLASFIIRVHRWAEDAFLVEGCHRVVLENGAVQVERHLGVAALDPDTGLVKHWDFYDLDQFDEAATRHTELSAATRGRFGNITTLLGSRANAFARLERWAVLTETLSRDIVVEDSTGAHLNESREELTVPGARQLGFGVESRRVLAIRGERLALVELREPDVDGEPFHRFAVEETNRDHEIVRITLYEPDQLAHAADDLDRRTLVDADEPTAAVLHTIQQAMSAFRHLDIDAAAEVFAERFEFMDHRPAGYPQLDKSGFLTAMETVGEMHGIVITTTDVLKTSSAGFVGPSTNYRVEAGGRLDESQHCIGLVTARDGRVTHMEMFPEDDPGAALARLDQLTGD
jgi:ketosteroid isomerase-like protein